MDTPESLLNQAVEAEKTARVCAKAGETLTAQRFYADARYYFEIALRLEKEGE